MVVDDDDVMSENGSFYLNIFIPQNMEDAAAEKGEKRREQLFGIVFLFSFISLLEKRKRMNFYGNTFFIYAYCLHRQSEYTASENSG